MRDRQPAAKLIVEAFVAPVVKMFVEPALDIVTTAGLGAHRTERKTAWMIGIDQLVADRWSFCKNAEPAERIDLFKDIDRRLRYGFAGGAVIAVTTGDEVAVNAMRGAICF